MKTRMLIIVALVCPSLVTRALAQANNARTELLRASGGRTVKGKLVADGASGLRFMPSGGGAPVVVRKGATIDFENPAPSPLEGMPPFHALLGLDQRVSGRLASVDTTTIRLENGPGGRPVTLLRGGVQVLRQRPGETLVMSEAFEKLDAAKWTSAGTPSLAAEPHLGGSTSVKMPSGSSSLTYRLAEPVAAGRLEVGYYDPGDRVAEQRWFVDLTFRGPTGLEPVRAILGWDDECLAAQSPQGPALAVQRLVRKKGWHRLVVRFDPERTELAIDSDELAHGAGPTGPLVELRLGSQTLGNAAAKPELAGFFDELSLARLAEPVGGLERDASQDELRLVGGDQLFGQLKSADPNHLLMAIDGKETMLGWSDVAGVYFRRAAVAGEPIEGPLVRLEWRSASGNDPRDVDRIEGALVELTDTALAVQTPYAGNLRVPRDRLLHLQLLGSARRLVLDASPHHLGDKIDPNFDPPQPEVHGMESLLALDRVPTGRAWVVLDVVQVLGEASHLAFSDALKKGELRTSVYVNGEKIDYLNHHITSRNETPERIRLAIPAGLLRSGENHIRLEQVGMATNPTELDDLGILCVAVEFDLPATAP